ncbi:hypothetical protein E8E12_004103 [Didymella heteroderae]|uniref:Uncharacterized protein n=1 Tax=Didymella heteroderae TaxID=1769908 RepID=A0A9P4WI62_9PLEO|nr:hypothetical protein E8E12_004103 [Didymella heteroderae]
MKLPFTALLPISLAFSTLAAPTDTGRQAHDVAPSFEAPKSAPPGNYCGKCNLTGTGRLRELRTSKPANKCNTLNHGENYGPCVNQYCGLCVMFKDDDCQGDITFWGGKGAGSFDAKAARSYYCM